MTPIAASLPLTGSLPASHGNNREQLAKAAQQFEAIFVRQMLAAARKSSFGGDVLAARGSIPSARCRTNTLPTWPRSRVRLAWAG